METLGTDEVIVERALGGDAEAFGELVRRWERRIFALAYGMLGREEERRSVRISPSKRTSGFGGSGAAGITGAAVCFGGSGSALGGGGAATGASSFAAGSFRRRDTN